MLNTIWLGMMFCAVIVGAFTGHLNDVVLSVTDSAKFAFELVLGLAGIMTFWLGIMEVATESGLMKIFTRLLKPILTFLFPQIPPNDPAMEAMILNITANMLGLTNAATPFGIEAMKALEKLNPHKGVASDAMCTFLAINTSSVQLIPTTAIAFLAANGASNPTDVVASSLIATSCSTIVALIVVKRLAKWKRYRIRSEKTDDFTI
ncbi:MAG: nucleoside recognition protein [Legionellales bacterium RIFCSPHIGHO2_12_FULL_37_14]|nr:MAG: nucleoside recognition protein [Legionellales bacterium RIFCSPHIGHO2_12_FULL_37_14]